MHIYTSCTRARVASMQYPLLLDDVTWKAIVEGFSHKSSSKWPAKHANTTRSEWPDSRKFDQISITWQNSIFGTIFVDLESRRKCSNFQSIFCQIRDCFDEMSFPNWMLPVIFAYYESMVLIGQWDTWTGRWRLTTTSLPPLPCPAHIEPPNNNGGEIVRGHGFGKDASPEVWFVTSHIDDNFVLSKQLFNSNEETLIASLASAQRK